MQGKFIKKKAVRSEGLYFFTGRRMWSSDACGLIRNISPGAINQVLSVTFHTACIFQTTFRSILTCVCLCVGMIHP